MIDICINPLSANHQYHQFSQIEEALEEMISCFKYMRPALDWSRARLIYDDSIEARSLMVGGAGIVAEVSALSNGDVRRQWFIYTKNRAFRAQGEHVTAAVSHDEGPDNKESLKGELRKDLIRDGSHWLSFGGTGLNVRAKLMVSHENTLAPISVVNTSRLSSFQTWWPRYEPSKKHGPTGYFRAGGKWVSQMPLDDHAAQEVLMTSVELDGDRYARHGELYYRFLKTHPDRDIYHGFLLEREEVPGLIFKTLEAR